MSPKRRTFLIFCAIFNGGFMVYDATLFAIKVAAGDWVLATFFAAATLLMLFFFVDSWRHLHGRGRKIVSVGRLKLTKPTDSPRVPVLTPIDPPLILNLDFTEFHPLDHPWWACMGYPGGLRRHLSLWHEYLAPDPLGSLLCFIGRHEWTEGWQTLGDWDGLESTNTLTMCRRCWAEKESHA